MIYSHSMDIYVKPDNSNSEYLSNITATSSNEKIVSVVKMVHTLTLTPIVLVRLLLM